jgi:hypothetical protein
MPEKIRQLRPGLNPRTWVPEASMLTSRPPKPLIYPEESTQHSERGKRLKSGIYPPVVKLNTRRKLMGSLRPCYVACEGLAAGGAQRTATL